MEQKRCRLQAHRGVSYDYPENTMLAYREAVKQGYDLIELDPKFTADNQCVLLHDRTITRTARDPNGQPPTMDKSAIDCLTYAEATQYEYGSWFDKAYAGEPLPTLREVLLFSQEAGIPLKFDHVVQTFTDEQLAVFFEEIEAYGDIALIGFTGSSLAYLNRVLQRFPMAVIHYDGPWNDEAKAYLATHVSPQRLTVWLRYDNPATSWCKLPPVTAACANEVRHYGSLGLWLLSQREELKQAVTVYHADVVETNGSLKPGVVADILGL